MAEAKKAVKKTAPVSRRKATSSKKTKTTKTKIVKGGSAVSQAVAAAVKESPRLQRQKTVRHQRMINRAQVRAAMPAPEPVAEVAAVQITDVSGVVYEPEEYQAMIDMYDATIKSIKEGEIVTGTVLGVSRDDIIVDVGFKSEGIIPIAEFTPPLNIQVGDTLEVFLEQIEDSSGQLILSKQKADFMRVWDKIRDVHDAGGMIEGIVARRIKGGLVVDIMGVDAFLPGSQVAMRQVPDFDALIGKALDVKIIKLNRSRRNIVVSRRMVLEGERESMRANLLSEIGVGQVRPGIVKNITDFGVFIDLGGVDGLLHITDMSWGRIRHPSEMVSLGEKIDVKILDFDENTSRISLGLKQMTPYPWENIEQKDPLGKKVTGRVVSITDYGAFVELEKGIEGLIHISEMSWTQHIKHPSKIMNVEDNIDAIILSVDKDNEKISLGIKQMEPDPWGVIDEKYPVGKIVTGRVRNLTAFGAFVELEEGIDGLVHISDMSWTRRIQHPSEVLKKGDKTDIKILRVDHENRRISLGFKQLTEDPWAELGKKYAVGTDCLGEVSKVLDRGLIVALDGSVEGFVPSAQLGRDDATDATAVFKAGEEIPLQVIEFDRGQHKIVLSVTAYYAKREQSELDDFLTKHPQTTSQSSLADAMPADLKAATEATAEEPTSTEAEATAEAAPVEEDAKSTADTTETPEVETTTEAVETTDDSEVSGASSEADSGNEADKTEPDVEADN